MSLRSMAVSLAGLPGAASLLRPWRGKAAILMYHRVVALRDPREDLYGRTLTVSVARFQEQMALLAGRWRVLSMDELPGHLEHGEGFAVAVTFDDGWLDTLEAAMPVLRRHGVPATVYVATRYPGGDGEVWWLELMDLLEERDALAFNWRGRDLAWTLDSDAARRAAFARLRALFMDGLDPAGQAALLAAVRGGSAPRSYAHLFMSWDRLRALDAEPLATIGAHTHSHANLAAMDEAGALAEMQRSRELLERELGHAVRHLAYPYGAKGEVGPREVALARGFDTAVTTWRHPLRPGCDLRALPRMPVGEGDDARTLAAKMAGLHNLARALRAER